MSEGLRIDFLQDPDTSSDFPPDHLVVKGVQSERLEAFIPAWLEEGVIGKIDASEIPPSYFSRMFTVPKDEGQWRPIIDLSQLNLLIKKKYFHMEDLKTVAKCIGPGLWGVKLDLKNAYFHVPLASEIWGLFSFAIKRAGRPTELFFFKRLPFGLTTAPWAFSRVIKPLKGLLRLENIQITSYLDDFLILAHSYEEAMDHTSKVITLLQDYGFQINWKKTSLAPQTRLEYLGVILDLRNQTFSLPEDKVQKVLEFCKKGQRFSVLTRRDLEKLVGFLNFAAQYLKLGKLLIKPIQRWMNSHTTTMHRDSLVPIDKTLKDALLPWAVPEFLHCPIPIREMCP